MRTKGPPCLHFQCSPGTESRHERQPAKGAGAPRDQAGRSKQTDPALLSGKRFGDCARECPRMGGRSGMKRERPEQASDEASSLQRRAFQEMGKGCIRTLKH
jgi:hypothetical protein